MPEKPFHLFIATDPTKIVVATRRPMVDGRATSTTDGHVTEITAEAYERTSPSGFTSTEPSTISLKSPPMDGDGSVATLVVGIVALTVAIWVCVSTAWWLGALLGLLTAGGGTYLAMRLFPPAADDWLRSHVVLTDWSDRGVIRAARTAVATISHAWPKLRSITSAPAPDSVLAQALWDLARMVHNRHAIRVTRQDLSRSLVDLPVESQMYAEVKARIEQAATRYTAVDTEITRRLADLTDLAERCQRFLREQAALEQARRVVRDADEVLGTIPAALDQASTPSAGEELAHSTAAILGAYRELSLQLGVDDVP